MAAPLMTVLTCSERREYFAATMASIRAAGGDSFPGEKIVFVDGANQLSPEDWAWYEAAAPGWRFEMTDPHGEKIGTKPSMLALLHKAAQMGATWLLYMEDDILLVKNAIPAVCLMAANMPKHLCFVSFCDIKNIGRLEGITECPGYDFEGPEGEGGHWGNQMLLLPGEALQHLRASTSMPDWNIVIPEHDKHWPKSAADIRLGKKASDIMLGVSLGCSPAPWRKYGVFTPSLAQHIGENSLVNPLATSQGWGRDTLTWRGAEFDALTVREQLQNPTLHQAVPHWRADQRTRLQIRFRGGNYQGNRTKAEKIDG